MVIVKQYIKSSQFERIVVLKNSYGEIICELDRSDDGFYRLPSSILTVPFDAGDVLEIEEIETEVD